jgi:hypothetical protein
MPTNRDDYPHIQFAATQIANKIRARKRSTDTSESITARRDLRRYYKVVKESVPLFTHGQASLLCDLLKDTMLEPIDRAPDLIWIEVQDAPDDLFDKWDAGRDQLERRLADLSFAKALATIDAVERFWASGGEKSVTEVGLCGDETMRN